MERLDNEADAKSLPRQDQLKETRDRQKTAMEKHSPRPGKQAASKAEFEKRIAENDAKAQPSTQRGRRRLIAKAAAHASRVRGPAQHGRRRSTSAPPRSRLRSEALAEGRTRTGQQPGISVVASDPERCECLATEETRTRQIAIKTAK
jgi:hypothetical protein